MCVFAGTRAGVCCRLRSQLLPLQVLQESSTQCACVSLKCFKRSSLQRQTGFNLHDVF